MKSYKKTLASLIAGSALMLNSCGGGGGSESVYSPSSGNDNQPVVENPQPGVNEPVYNPPTEEGNIIYSVNGKALLIFKDGVIIDNHLSSQSIKALTNKGPKTVIVPHTGANSVLLQVNDVDSNEVYVLGEVEGNPLTSHPYFGINNSSGQIININGYDPLLNQNLNNYPTIKVSINNGQGTLDWKFQDITGNSEGNTYSITNLRLVNLLPQGDTNYLDIGDYFQNFDIKFNALPTFNVVGTQNCPVNKVDTDGDGVYDRFEIPLNLNNFTGNCIAFYFSNPDNISYSPQYSLDNGNTWNNITYEQTEEKSFVLNPGQKVTIDVKVKEFIDQNQNISDSKKIGTFTIFRDEDRCGNTQLQGTCTDSTTGNSWNVSDLGSCYFADPGNNSTAGTIEITGSSALYGQCRISVLKNNVEIDSQIQPCNNINYTYIVPATDKGKGTQWLDFIILKLYDKGSQAKFYEGGVDCFSLGYRVNQTPTIP